jgi:microsomal dipeptidase-like Zn-dependent dipeptidase
MTGQGGVFNLLTSFNAVICFVTDHINYVRRIAGVDSVGLGAGYDGINL